MTSKNPKPRAKHLHESRLSTTDETGHRVYLFPEDVQGRFRRWRTFVYSFLIVLYLVLPWIHYQGQQVILIDIAKRNFFFFGWHFKGHDIPFIFFLLTGWVFFFALLTTLFGRAWCGWACPQTVFIDTLFRRIERWVEGAARARQKLKESSWTLSKLSKKTFKWMLFLLVSLHIVHSFLGYFVGTHELLAISLKSPQENWVLFLTMLIGTGVILFDFGWFREQFCIIACPYGRIQSVMMDERSLTVAYDSKRGEPRRQKGLDFNKEGDCVNCENCIKVCPTGIDIREGTQLECIACTACIDACDEVMEKVGKPVGLIRYESEEGLKGKKSSFFRPRVWVYLGLFAVLLGAFTYSLSQREIVSVVYTRGKSPYQAIDQGRTLLNFVQVHLISKEKTPRWVALRSQNKQVEVIISQQKIWLKSEKTEHGIFLRFPVELRGEQVVLEVYALDEPEHVFNQQSLTLLGGQK